MRYPGKQVESPDEVMSECNFTNVNINARRVLGCSAVHGVANFADSSSKSSKIVQVDAGRSGCTGLLALERRGLDAAWSWLVAVEVKREMVG